MICVPLDDIQELFQGQIDDLGVEESPLSDEMYAVLASLHGYIDALEAMAVDTEARACPECGDPPAIGGLAVNCQRCLSELIMRGDQ